MFSRHLSKALENRGLLNKSNSLSAYLSKGLENPRPLDKSNSLSAYLSKGLENKRPLDKANSLSGCLSSGGHDWTPLDSQIRSPDILVKIIITVAAFNRGAGPSSLPSKQPRSNASREEAATSRQL